MGVVVLGMFTSFAVDENERRCVCVVGRLSGMWLLEGSQSVFESIVVGHVFVESSGA